MAIALLRTASHESIQAKLRDAGRTIDDVDLYARAGDIRAAGAAVTLAETRLDVISEVLAKYGDDAAWAGE